MALVPIDGKQPYALWEDAILRQMYPWGGSLAVKIYLNRSTISITKRTRTLKLRRTSSTTQDIDTIKEIIEIREKQEAQRQEKLAQQESLKQERAEKQEAQRQEKLAQQESRAEKQEAQRQEKLAQQNILRHKIPQQQLVSYARCLARKARAYGDICEYCGKYGLLDEYLICSKCANLFMEHSERPSTSIHCSCPICGNSVGFMAQFELRKSLYHYCSSQCAGTASHMLPMPTIQITPQQMLDRVYSALYHYSSKPNKTSHKALDSAREYLSQSENKMELVSASMASSEDGND